MRKIAICDDEASHRERIAQLVRGLKPAAELRLFCAPIAFLSAVQTEGYTPDAAIVDIQMDGMSGIELAERLNRALPQCAIIFVTSYLGFATDVYDTKHVYFILKSELEQRLGTALEKALTPQPLPVLHYPSPAGYRNTPSSEVLYLERVLRKTKLVLPDGSEEWTTLAPAQLLENDAPQQFIRCHQSFWVNFRHVRTLESDCFLLDSGLRIPISRTYRAAAREQFFALLR